MSAIRHWNTGHGSELVSTLPVTSTTYDFMVVYSQEIANIRPGDVIQVMSEFESTNPYDHVVMLGCRIVLGASSTDTGGTNITEDNVFNISPAMHHGTFTKVGTYVLDEAAPSAFVNVVAYARYKYAEPGDALTVEPGYGRLSVILFEMGEDPSPPQPLSAERRTLGLFRLGTHRHGG